LANGPSRRIVRDINQDARGVIESSHSLQCGWSRPIKPFLLSLPTPQHRRASTKPSQSFRCVAFLRWPEVFPSPIIALAGIGPGYQVLKTLYAAATGISSGLASWATQELFVSLLGQRWIQFGLWPRSHTNCHVRCYESVTIILEGRSHDYVGWHCPRRYGVCWDCNWQLNCWLYWVAGLFPTTWPKWHWTSFSGPQRFSASSQPYFEDRGFWRTSVVSCESAMERRQKSKPKKHLHAKDWRSIIDRAPTPWRDALWTAIQPVLLFIPLNDRRSVRFLPKRFVRYLIIKSTFACGAQNRPPLALRLTIATTSSAILRGTGWLASPLASAPQISRVAGQDGVAEADANVFNRFDATRGSWGPILPHEDGELVSI